MRRPRSRCWSSTWAAQSWSSPSRTRSASSRVVNLRISHPRARTAEGVGPGSTLGDLVRAYGPARFDEAECVLYATFERAEGLSFRLWLPRPFECTDVTRLAESQRGVPSEARVQTVVVHGRDRPPNDR